MVESDVCVGTSEKDRAEKTIYRTCPSATGNAMGNHECQLIKKEAV